MNRPGSPDAFGDTFVAMAAARAIITATRLGRVAQPPDGRSVLGAVYPRPVRALPRRARRQRAARARSRAARAARRRRRPRRLRDGDVPPLPAAAGDGPGPALERAGGPAD